MLPAMSQPFFFSFRGGRRKTSVVLEPQNAWNYTVSSSD